MFVYCEHVIFFIQPRFQPILCIAQTIITIFMKIVQEDVSFWKTVGIPVGHLSTVLQPYHDPVHL